MLLRTRLFYLLGKAVRDGATDPGPSWASGWARNSAFDIENGRNRKSCREICGNCEGSARLHKPHKLRTNVGCITGSSVLTHSPISNYYNSGREGGLTPLSPDPAELPVAHQ
jgi:hypothetical protein